MTWQVQRACVHMCLCVSGSFLTQSRWRKQSVKGYRQTGTRLKHLEGVDNPLIVRAQQRTDVLARRIAQPLGHASPAPLLAHHLKAAFIRHHLQRTCGTLTVKHTVVAKWQLACASQCVCTHPDKPMPFYLPTFDRLKRSRMRRSMCGIFNEDAWISQNLAILSK